MKENRQRNRVGSTKERVHPNFTQHYIPGDDSWYVVIYSIKKRIEDGEVSLLQLSIINLLTVWLYTASDGWIENTYLVIDSTLLVSKQKIRRLVEYRVRNDWKYESTIPGVSKASKERKEYFYSWRKSYECTVSKKRKKMEKSQSLCSSKERNQTFGRIPCQKWLKVRPT